jgi:hypothetical protein
MPYTTSEVSRFDSSVLPPLAFCRDYECPRADGSTFSVGSSSIASILLSLSRTLPYVAPPGAILTPHMYLKSRQTNQTAECCVGLSSKGFCESRSAFVDTQSSVALCFSDVLPQLVPVNIDVSLAVSFADPRLHRSRRVCLLPHWIVRGSSS